MPVVGRDGTSPLVSATVQSWRAGHLGSFDASFITLAEALDAPLIMVDAKQAAANGHQAPGGESLTAHAFTARKLHQSHAAPYNVPSRDEDVYLVALDVGVAGDEREALGGGLCDEHAVEGVTVKDRSAAGSEGVRVGHW